MGDRGVPPRLPIAQHRECEPASSRWATGLSAETSRRQPGRARWPRLRAIDATTQLTREPAVVLQRYQCVRCRLPRWLAVDSTQTPGPDVRAWQSHAKYRAIETQL